MRKWHFAERKFLDINSKEYLGVSWAYMEALHYAIDEVNRILKEAKPGSTIIVAPDVQQSFDMTKDDGDEIARWALALNTIPPMKDTFVVEIYPDDQVTLVKMNIGEHIEANPAAAQIAGLSKLYHHHILQ